MNTVNYWLIGMTELVSPASTAQASIGIATSD